jgi:hypothetical protein
MHELNVTSLLAVAYVRLKSLPLYRSISSTPAEVTYVPARVLVSVTTSRTAQV